MRRLASLAAAILMLLPALGPSNAQTPSRGDSTHTSATLFTWRDGVLAAGFSGLTVAMFPLDRSLAKRLQSPGNQENNFLRQSTRDVQYIADPGAVLIGAGVYVLGRTRGWHQVADLGVHGGEAVVLAGGITAVLKGLAGRARPNMVADTNPHSFAFLRGLTKGDGYQSFPSGHTTVAFAAAAAVSSESRRWWPHGQWVVGPVLYTGATLVGVSRMYNNAHWASDVALAAAIGTFSGLKVVRFAHAHPNNPIDRILMPMQVSVGPDGAARVGWSSVF